MHGLRPWSFFKGHTTRALNKCYNCIPSSVSAEGSTVTSPSSVSLYDPRYALCQLHMLSTELQKQALPINYHYEKWWPSSQWHICKDLYSQRTELMQKLKKTTSEPQSQLKQNTHTQQHIITGVRDWTLWPVLKGEQNCFSNNTFWTWTQNSNLKRLIVLKRISKTTLNYTF